MGKHRPYCPHSQGCLLSCSCVMLSFQESSGPNTVMVFMEMLQGISFFWYKTYKALWRTTEVVYNSVNALAELAEQ